MRGGFLGIAITGGVAALVVIVGAIVAVRACSADGPATATSPSAAPGPNAAIGAGGMVAPGTDALRALGCEHAVVVDMAKVLGSTSRMREGEPRTIITCDVGAGAPVPGCERVANTYFGAVGALATDTIGVRVLRTGAPAPLCSKKYAPNGADLGTF